MRWSPATRGDDINVMVKVAPSRAGHLEGLLGDPGEAYDQLVGGNGVIYSMDQLAFPSDSVSNFDVLYHQFAQSWRISQQSSLFYYPKGQSTATFTDLAFPSKALTVASLTPEDRRRRGEGLQSRRYYQLLLALRLRLRPGPHRWS